MTQTQVQLYNLAAQVLGARGKLISTSDKSRYAEVFDLWFDPVRAIVLKSAHWACASKVGTLNLVGERSANLDWTNTDPVPGARYAYAVPSDFLYPRYLSTYGHFSMGMLGDTKVIFAHEPGAILWYTFDQEDVGKWEPELFFAVAHALAAYTAITLTGKQSLTALAEQKANSIMRLAQSNADNISQDPTRAVASWHAARGYAGAPTPARFLYPFGALIAVGESANVK